MTTFKMILNSSAMRVTFLVFFLGLSCPKLCVSQTDSSRQSHFKVVQTSEGRFRAEISSDVDPSWSAWKDRAYNFGFDPGKTPRPGKVSGILSTPYMIQVRGDSNEINKKRWGCHLF